MDEIVFVVRSEHHPPVGYWSVLDVRINGVRLQELVHTAQVESTYQPAGSSKAAYMGLDPSVASTGHFIGQPVVMSIQGRPVLDRVLLRCTCGEPGCENVTAQVRVDDQQVIWREFRASGDPLDLGPFEFDRSKYEEALQRAATSYESR